MKVTILRLKPAPRPSGLRKRRVWGPKVLGKALRIEARSCNPVCDEYVLNRLFIEGIPGSILPIMRSHTLELKENLYGPWPRTSPKALDQLAVWMVLVEHKSTLQQSLTPTLEIRMVGGVSEVYTTRPRQRSVDDRVPWVILVNASCIFDGTPIA